MWRGHRINLDRRLHNRPLLNYNYREFGILLLLIHKVRYDLKLLRKVVFANIANALELIR